MPVEVNWAPLTGGGVVNALIFLMIANIFRSVRRNLHWNRQHMPEFSLPNAGLVDGEKKMANLVPHEVINKNILENLNYTIIQGYLLC